MTTARRRPPWRLEVGFGLISFSVALLLLAVGAAATATDDVILRIIILVVAASLVGTLWVSAVRNGTEEREARRRLLEEHPGSLVERVRLWSLPQGRVGKNLGVHFIIADPDEIAFQTIDETELLRIPVAEIGFIDPVAARGDSVRDKALTIIYGDEENVVQVFTLTYAGIESLGARIRAAIGWPAQGAPSH